MENNLPSQAQVVIIGGGVIGCNVAYHLTKLGWKDVVLLERKELTSGTTWHAAGLVVSGGATDETLLWMTRYSRDLYTQLEKETGLTTGFRPVGYLQIASTPRRLEAYRREMDFVRNLGVDKRLLTPAEVKDLFPLLKTDDILAGFYTADEGRANPVDVTMSVAKGARMGGAKIFEGVKVTGIKKKDGRVTGVVTDHGEIAAEYVVNCAGMWGREVGEMAGVRVPLQASEHYYLITEPLEGVHPDLPIVEDPERYTYYREEVGGLLVGLFEPVAAPWGMNGIPKDFSFGEISPDWDRMMPFLEKAFERIPALESARVRKFFCGPESFTGDINPMLGEAPELKNFFVAAGMNSLGILLGGGIGFIMAHWIVEGLPPVDVTSFHVDRALPFESTPKFRRQRTVEQLGVLFGDGAYPTFQQKSARNIRRSALHDRFAAAGAYFGSSAGWEYAEWFKPDGTIPERLASNFDRQGWFQFSADEHIATRNEVGLFDMTLMSKFLVQGKDSEKVLNQICANNVAVPVGRIVYTQWLNERGLIEADLTVTRLADDKYLVVSSDAVHRHVETWLHRHIPQDAHCFVTDITSGITLLNIMGPKSRALLQKLTSVDISNDAFPYMTAREIDLDYANILAMRVTYVGELGWELHIPTEYSLTVYDALIEAGKEFGLRHAGLTALNSLRLEKAYRDFGHDIDNMDSPINAGLGFTVSWDKPGGFIGKEQLLAQKAAGIPKSRVVQFLLEDPEPMLYHAEPIFRNGKYVGYVRAGAYGHSLGASVALAMVEDETPITSEYLQTGSFEIQVNGIHYPAKASLQPFYDPKGEKIRC